MKKILAALLIIALAGVGAYYYFYQGREEAPKFKLEKVGLRDIRSTVTATGSVNAVKTVMVGTQVSGTIKEIFVDYNSQVKKGHLLAKLDSSFLEAQVEQARANILFAQANLEKAEVSLAEAKRNMDRSKILYEQNFIAKNDLDVAETNFKAAQAQVKAVKAQIDQGKGALKQAEVNLRYTSITSPVSGIVVSKNVDVGQTVAASFQTPTLFNIAEDLTQMQINASIVEADVGMIREEQPVEFTVDAYPDMQFKGQVTQIRNAPVTVQNVVTYDVIIRVANPDLKLKPGMTANTTIIVTKKEKVLAIPNAALRFRLQEKGAATDQRGPAGERQGPPEGLERKGPPGERQGPPGGKMQPAETGRGERIDRGQGIWIMRDGKPTRIKLITGITDGNYSEVVSGNLQEGEETIVALLNTQNKKKTERPLGQTPGFIR